MDFEVGKLLTITYTASVSIIKSLFWLQSHDVGAQEESELSRKSTTNKNPL